MVDKKVLWRVPIYSIIAGLITFRLNIFLFSKFAVSKLPDGTIVSIIVSEIDNSSTVCYP